MAATHRRAVMERRELEHRRKEFHREDIIKQLKNDAVINGILDSDERIDDKRRLRAQKLRDEEMRTHEALIEEEEERKRQIETLRRDEEIMAQLEKFKLGQLRDEKLRQSIRANSTELRDLEQKLNYAYMNKERSLQVKAKELLVKQEKVQEALQARQAEKVMDKYKQKDIEKEKQAHERTLGYQKELAGQLAEHEARKQQEFEQFLKEKAMVDAIVRKIALEDELVVTKRLQKAHETKQYIEDFIQEQGRWKEIERSRRKEENDKIEAYAKLLLNRENEIKSLKKGQEEARNQIYKKLAADMANKEKVKEELENLRIELYQEEQEEAARQRDQEILRKRIRKRLELLDAYHQQIENKKLLLKKAKEEEDVFREKLTQKFAEDERLEQMTQQKRRLKKLEHKQAIEALIDERRKRLHQDEVEHKKELERQQELDKYRQLVIEQERQRLLREHAGKLIGFLPKGVLRDQKDLDLFDAEFKTKFESSQPEF